MIRGQFPKFQSWCLLTLNGKAIVRVKGRNEREQWIGFDYAYDCQHCRSRNNVANFDNVITFFTIRNLLIQILIFFLQLNLLFSFELLVAQFFIRIFIQYWSD